MTNQQCSCAPYICPKCPDEYKSLAILKQSLVNKHSASKRQSLLVAQKLIKLKLNCQECIQNSRVSVNWCASVCFPAERALQEHIKTTHKSVNRSKNERSRLSRDPTNVECTCLRVFQCPSCPQCYQESSDLEKHWRLTGHEPENNAVVLSILLKRAQAAKSNCRKCTQDQSTHKQHDACMCRKAFICSECLDTFSCYPSLKKHWKTLNYHSSHGNGIVDIGQSECLSCSSQVKGGLIQLGNTVSVSCSEAETPSHDDGAAIVKHPNSASEIQGVTVTSPCPEEIENENCKYQLLDNVLSIDTDDSTDDGDDDHEKTYNTHTSRKRPLPSSDDKDCTCPVLKCESCCCSFAKCRDLYQHMKDSNHINLIYFKDLRKKKKDAKLMCLRHTDQDLISRKILKTRIVLNEDGKRVNEKNKVKAIVLSNCKPLLDSNPTKSETSILHHALLRPSLSLGTKCPQPTKMKPVQDCRIRPKTQQSALVAADISKSLPSNIYAQKVLTEATCYENTQITQISKDDQFDVQLDAAVVKEDADDLDCDTEDLVTITVSHNSSNESSPAVSVTTSSLLEHSTDVQGCFQQCLKLVKVNCTCKAINRTSSRGTSAEDNKVPGCRTCCSDISCFSCSGIFPSYDDLKEHFINDHSMHCKSEVLSKPSELYVKIVSQYVNALNCVCTEFLCKGCKRLFMQCLPLLHHVLIDHPDMYSSFPFFLSQKNDQPNLRCPRCSILENLCIANYYLFVKVLIKIEGGSEAEHMPLLQWCPPAGLENNVENGPNFVDDRDNKVVCYVLKQQPTPGKKGKVVKKETKHATSGCICPMVKCPQCLIVTANFRDLRKHTRIKNHCLQENMRLLWEKYRVIKENCPACCKYSFVNFIQCPHCPHLSFDDDDTAQTHMDTVHRGLVDGDRNNVECTCSKVFHCMTCNTYHRTPQGLHHHMRRLGHETRENFDALPRMMRARLDGKRNCPRCSLFMSSKARDVTSTEEQEQCTCKRAICNTCGNSYKKIGALMDHMKKMRHPVNSEYIKCEQKKLINSLRACQKCNSMEERYCIFCNSRDNFIYHHIRTHHHDAQIMLLNGENGELLSEYDLQRSNSAKYQCSLCLKCFLHTTTLRRHIRQIHPDSYFTLQYLDLSTDTVKIEHFTTRKEIKIIALRNKRKQN